ncbi:hypothetical protein ACFYMW_39345 [Streptomyces sp. NPDC006692]|uniref:hypothetical protein n=1 Tax=unclassified Streptomyces TaxID=2593676 RepID=UPI0036A15AAA
MRLLHWPRLLLAVYVVLLATGCVAVAPKPTPRGGGFVQDGGHLPTVAPSPRWPEPVQAPANATLTPMSDPTPSLTPTPTPSPAAVTSSTEPVDRASSNHRRPGTNNPAPRPPDRHRAAPQPDSPPPRHQRTRPRTDYDASALCSWAQGTGLDPSVVRACRQQLGH